MTDTPKSPWSEANPRLQRAWDATSLRALMFCPRYYQYQIIEGWRASGIDLEFGLYFHDALDTYDKARLSGVSKADAQVMAVRKAMEVSGHYIADAAANEDQGNAMWVPWSGRYENLWHCKGDVPYQNAKGNRAKCPYAHKGNWQRTEPPGVCGECGGTIEAVDQWVSERPDKDRYALLRAVCWYIEEQPKELDGAGPQPYAFPDGTPAVELNFVVPLPWHTPDGEDYLLCGYLDGLRQFGTEMFVAERKSTKKALNKMFWNGFSPHIQVDTYDIAAAAMFPDLDIKGVLIEGAQALVSGAKFGKHLAYRSEARREEFMKDLRRWLWLAEHYAEENYWPMNRANCWLCPFKGVCSKDPVHRETLLKENFRNEHWNPLEER